MKQWSILAIRKIQIKPTRRYYFLTPTRRVIINKTIITNVGEDTEKLETSYSASGNVKWHSHFEKWADRSWMVKQSYHRS
jgi:hypothetical protein